MRPSHIATDAQRCFFGMASGFTTAQTNSKILSVGQCSCVTGDTPNDYAASDVGGCVARLDAKYPDDDFVILATPFPAPTRPLGYVRPQHFRTRQRAPARGLFAGCFGLRASPLVCLRAGSRAIALEVERPSTGSVIDPEKVLRLVPLLCS